MLGWEYPPFLNGGLGVATTGIAQALAETLSLQLIVPRAQTNLNPRAFDLIGLTEQPPRRIKNQRRVEKRKGSARSAGTSI